MGLNKARKKKNVNPAKPADTSFEFKNSLSIVKSTGRMASTLAELRDNIEAVSSESIFYHTYKYFSKGAILEYTNDFAEWVGISLEEGALAEHLSNIDIFSFGSTEDLRAKILEVIIEYQENFPEPRPAIQGNEFYFSESYSFVFPAGLRARNLAEFYMALKYLDPGSIYYHFFEARVRLGEGEDDLSKWIDEVIEAPGLVQEIKAIDPFMHTIERIREMLIGLVELQIKSGMEVL
jgi:hypothetical protein